MTELFANPIARETEALGGKVRLNIAVEKLVKDSNGIVGVKLKGNETIMAKDAIIATPIGQAKSLLKECVEGDS